MAPWPVIRERLGPIVPPAVLCSLLALVPTTTCLVKLIAHRPCPACGMTRASLHLLHGDLRGSLALHPLALPSALALLTALALALALPARHPAWDRFVRTTLTVFGVAFIAVWAVRMAGFLPPV